ncbi:MAG: RecX family transcriptional regulator [Balneolaceae bacterium]|nr:RecX family transcriptional regulator [Balneolaceae bacterium]
MSNEPDHILPAKISSISVQKKNKERYSLFADDKFLIGVSESTLIDLDLRKGVLVTPSLFRKIQKAEGRFAVKSYMMKLLARRDHARRELYNKAIKKDYPKETITSVIDELEEMGYIDEKAFAQKYAADKSHLNQWGPTKIRAHLYKKGIKESYIDEGIRKTFEDIDLREMFFNLVLKRKRRFLREEDSYKRKKKVFNYLNQKGFKSNSIFKHLDELMEAITDE